MINGKMKIKEVINYTCDRLKKAGIDTAALDARLLVCKYLGKDKVYLINNADMNINPDKDFEELVKRRENYEPMQYILGKAEFYGITFNVDENVLIPRGDTEVLVERVIEYIKDNSYVMLDIGTGSGCIPISVAKNCKNVKSYTVDISKEATSVARENAIINQVESRITFINMDILKSFPEFEVDCIVSNPPYIEKSVIPTLMNDVKNYEPIIALDGGEDGLIFYRRIIQKGYDILKNGGMIAFEVGHNQSEAVADILLKRGFYNIEIIKDLAGIERVVTAIK